MNLHHPATFDVNHLTGQQHWSPDLRNIFGVGDKTEIDIELLFKLVHPQDRRAVLGAISGSLRVGGPERFEIEHRIIRADGDLRWLFVAARTVFHGEGEGKHPECTVGMVTDITRQKEAELAEEMASA
jgi:PAS domain S-box-containing protein